MKTILKEYGGFRRTASGISVRRDEPDELLQMKQADIIRKNQLALQKKIALERLKKKGVPVRSDGSKITFEDFMWLCQSL